MNRGKSQDSYAGINASVMEITSCEVCGSSDLEQVLDLGFNSLCDDLIPIGSNAKTAKYPVEILFCFSCLTAHHRYQVEKQILFPQSYHYRARATGSVLTGMQDLVGSIQDKYGTLQGKKVLDVGCNDGSLLDVFAQSGAETLGVEPTEAAFDSVHKTYHGFFDQEAVEWVLDQYGQPDVIVFTNVFAHIENLPNLLNSLRALVGKSTLIVIENHYLGAVVEYLQFDTFYHEHPRTYSFKSFETLAGDLGMGVDQVEFVSRYGGNIRVFLRREVERTVAVSEISVVEKVKLFQSKVSEVVTSQRTKVHQKVEREGRLRAKAFPGRAAIVLQALDLDENEIEAIYEIRGSLKVNNYAPGTRIPILPEAELYGLDDQSLDILNLAWHIPAEVRRNLSNNGYAGSVLDVLPWECPW